MNIKAKSVWKLFSTFFRIGAFTFGGGYAMLPLIQAEVTAKGWIAEESIVNFVAVSESTPGPIMVNLATYIGSNQAGFLGAFVATLAVVLPSFIIILSVTASLKTALKNKYVQAVLRGLKPCVIGIVLATGIYMVLRNCFGTISAIQVNMQAIIITALLVASMFCYKHFANKKLSPILLIVISAVAGMVVYGI